MKKQSLGRGLSALFAEENGVAAGNVVSAENVADIDVTNISPSPYQPRQEFDLEALNELAESIKANGVIQPILVRPDVNNPGSFELIAGERRLRATKIAGLEKIPAIIKNYNDKQSLEAALIENLQRKDLTFWEEAEGYKRMLSEFGYTQDELSKILGKSRSHLSNMLRILELPESVKNIILENGLSLGHAKAILAAQDPVAYAQQVVSGGMSVREAEKSLKVTKKTKDEADMEQEALAEQLSNLLKMKVKINFKGKGGTIAIDFKSIGELDIILSKLNKS
jgi:ParB family chromosome partitioning protein